MVSSILTNVIKWKLIFWKREGRNIYSHKILQTKNLKISIGMDMVNCLLHFVSIKLYLPSLTRLHDFLNRKYPGGNILKYILTSIQLQVVHFVLFFK